MLPKNLCFDFFIFGSFLLKKTAKIDQKLRNLAKSKPFDKTFGNLVCKCFHSKKIQQKIVFRFWHFLAKKTAKIDQNYENW